MIGELSEDNEDGSNIRCRLCYSVDELECVEFMVVDTSNVHFTMDVGVVDSSIIAECATIGSPVYQCAS